VPGDECFQAGLADTSTLSRILEYFPEEPIRAIEVARGNGFDSLSVSLIRPSENFSKRRAGVFSTTRQSMPA